MNFVVSSIIDEFMNRIVLLSSALLAFTALSAVQSSAQTRIHSAILVIDTSNNASYNQVHWLVGTPYLAIKASNVGVNNWTAEWATIVSNAPHELINETQENKYTEIVEIGWQRRNRGVFETFCDYNYFIDSYCVFTYVCQSFCSQGLGLCIITLPCLLGPIFHGGSLCTRPHVPSGGSMYTSGYKPTRTDILWQIL